jgi:hypothetical protein
MRTFAFLVVLLFGVLAQPPTPKMSQYMDTLAPQAWRHHLRGIDRMLGPNDKCDVNAYKAFQYTQMWDTLCDMHSALMRFVVAYSSDCLHEVHPNIVLVALSNLAQADITDMSTLESVFLSVMYQMYAGTTILVRERITALISEEGFVPHVMSVQHAEFALHLLMRELKSAGVLPSLVEQSVSFIDNPSTTTSTTTQQSTLCLIVDNSEDQSEWMWGGSSGIFILVLFSVLLVHFWSFYWGSTSNTQQRMEEPEDEPEVVGLLGESFV